MVTDRPTQPEDSTSTRSSQRGRRPAPLNPSLLDVVVPFRHFGPKLTLIGHGLAPKWFPAVLWPRQQAKLVRIAEDEEHAMSHKLNCGIAVIGRTRCTSWATRCTL